MLSVNRPPIGIKINPLRENIYIQNFSVAGTVPPPPGEGRMITEDGDPMITETLSNNMIIE